jgi:anti-anti-sigma factor
LAFATGDRSVAETIVKGPGRLDAGAVRDFEHKIAAASLLGNERLLVDLSLTSFITSMALRSLLTAARRLDKAGGRLVVWVSSPENIRLFTASGLDQVIPVRTTLAQARAALAAR